jgi:D-alanine-D-alanine ligase
LLRVNLLCGGRSLEHAISCGMYEFMRECIKQNDAQKVTVCNVFFIDRQGRLFHFDVGDSSLPTLDEISQRGKAFKLEKLTELLAASDAFTFSLLQGQDGEDGTIQGVAKFFRLPCNLSSPGVVGLAFDKHKQTLIAEAMCVDLLQPMHGVCIDALQWHKQRADLQPMLGRPCVLKPNMAGSSYGVQMCDALTESVIAEYAKAVSGYDDLFVVQPYIEGREVTVGVLWSAEADEFVELPVIEISTTSKLFDFAQKWSSGALKLSFVNPLDGACLKAEKASRRLFRSLGMLTYARFDYRIDNDGRVFFLEVNTSPGLMESSLFSKMLLANKLSVVDLILLSYDAYRWQESQEEKKRSTIATLRGAGHQQHMTD